MADWPRHTSEGQLNVQADSTLSVTLLLEATSLYAAQLLQSEKPLVEFVTGQINRCPDRATNRPSIPSYVQHS